MSGSNLERLTQQSVINWINASDVHGITIGVTPRHFETDKLNAIKLPMIVVRATREAEEIPGSGVYRMKVEIDLLSQADDSNEAIVDEHWSKLVSILNWDSLAQGMSDLVEDFHCYGVNRTAPSDKDTIDRTWRFRFVLTAFTMAMSNEDKSSSSSDSSEPSSSSSESSISPSSISSLSTLSSDSSASSESSETSSISSPSSDSSQSSQSSLSSPSSASSQSSQSSTGYALQLFTNDDGDGDIAETTSALPALSGAFTVDFWIKSNGVSGTLITQDNCVDGGCSAGWAFWEMPSDDGQQIRFAVFPSYPSPFLQTTGEINNGQWHHIVGSYDGTNIHLLMDGVSYGSTLATYTAVTKPVRISGHPGGGSEWGGWIDDVKIFAGSTLTAYWRFDEGSGSTVNDSTGNGHNLSLSGGTFQFVDGR